MLTCVLFGGNFQNQFLKEERQACTPCIAHFCFPIFIGQCQRPSSGCTASFDIYKSVDCDGDGILDHAWCHVSFLCENPTRNALLIKIDS